MQINQALGKLTPAHPDLLPILASVREKYNIPEIAPGDPTLAEIVGADNMPDVEAMRDEIEQELRKVPEFLPEKAQLVFKILEDKENDFAYPEMDELSEEMRKMVKALMLLATQFVEPDKYAFDIVQIETIDVAIFQKTEGSIYRSTGHSIPLQHSRT